MATAVHHQSHARSSGIPSGLYWVTGFVIALIALTLLYTSSVGTNVATTLVEPPMIPFMPLM